MRLNYSDNMYAVQLLNPQQITGDGNEATGSAVDLKNCVRGVLVVPVGEMDDATTLTLQIQTCDTLDGTFQDVLSADQEITTADKNKVHCFELDNLKRYVRLQYTVTNAKNVTFGAAVIGWHRPLVPVS